jgi:hypothetical protein
MGNISRTVLWTTLAVIICFLLAWGINSHRTQSKIPVNEHVQQGIKVPANPGATGPSFMAISHREVLLRVNSRTVLILYGDSRQGQGSNHPLQLLIIGYISVPQISICMP